MVRIVGGEVVSEAALSRRNSHSQAGTPVLGSSSSALGAGMAPLSLGSTPLLSSALPPHHSPLSPHPPALSLHPSSAQSATSSGNSSLASTPSLHSTALPPARERGTSPLHHRLSPAMMHNHAAAGAHATSPPPLALGTGPHSHPHAHPHAQQQSSSAQFTNPYLSHTGFGGPGVPSGPFNDAGAGGSGSGSEADAAYAAAAAAQAHAAAHHSAAFSAARAAAEAAVASYYPYHMLQGFLGPGFILGHANLQPSPQPPQQPLYTDPASNVSPDPSSEGESQQPAPQQQLHARSISSSSNAQSLPHSGASSSASSSCPSPLLTSTSERRRSKPHIQFVPPTHSVTPNGLVLPLIPPPPPPSTAVAAAPGPSTSARVSHAFNLFGLPPVFVYEIRVPPHVYLLTALILYFIGPPALIPLVATFFFYRWHLQNQTSSSAATAAAAHATSATAGAQGVAHQGITHHQTPLAGHKSMPGASKGGGHPSGLPKAQHPSPSLGPSGSGSSGAHQRRHPNIHSLSDL